MRKIHIYLGVVAGALVFGAVSACAFFHTGMWSTPPAAPTPGGLVACDYGPPTTVPALAQAGGFTHCVLNADFNSTSSDVSIDGPSINWSDTSTYINQCMSAPAQAALPWKFWIYWWAGVGTQYDNGFQPCNHATIITDPYGGGFKVLNQFSLASELSANSGGNPIVGAGLAWPTCHDPCTGSGLALPIAHYTEWTYRLSTAVNTMSNAPYFINGFDDTIYSNGNAYPSGTPYYGFVEQVPLEFYANGNTSHSSWDFYPGGLASGSRKALGCCAWTPDFGNGYHTLAYMVTTDGTSDIWECMTYDGVLVPDTGPYPGNLNCAPFAGPQQTNPPTPISAMPAAIPGVVGIHGFHITGATGATNAFATPPTTTPPARLDTYWKKLRVFDCANYRGLNNNCTGVIVKTKG